MPAWRYFGSLSSQYWIRPATLPSTSIVRRVDSGSSQGKPSWGSSHQRTTSGVRWMRSSSPASLSVRGRRVSTGVAQLREEARQDHGA